MPGWKPGPTASGTSSAPASPSRCWTWAGSTPPPPGRCSCIRRSSAAMTVRRKSCSRVRTTRRSTSSTITPPPPGRISGWSMPTASPWKAPAWTSASTITRSSTRPCPNIRMPTAVPSFPPASETFSSGPPRTAPTAMRSAPSGRIRRLPSLWVLRLKRNHWILFRRRRT